jgi:hypothetical protein
MFRELDIVLKNIKHLEMKHCGIIDIIGLTTLTQLEYAISIKSPTLQFFLISHTWNTSISTVMKSLTPGIILAPKAQKGSKKFRLLVEDIDTVVENSWGTVSNA